MATTQTAAAATTIRRFRRDHANRKLLGVCSGIGQYFGVDPMWIRIAFLVGTLFAGQIALIYFAIALIAD